MKLIKSAEGEATRFRQLYTEYIKAPEVTRERLYLEAVESVLENTSKVMIDVDGGNNLMYLPLDKIIKQTNPSNYQDNKERNTYEICISIQDAYKYVTAGSYEELEKPLVLTDEVKEEKVVNLK